MIVTDYSLLGLLLGASLILLFFCLISFRRGGLRGLLLTSLGLAVHSILTALLLAIGLETDWLARLEWWVVPLADALVLAVVLLVGTIGGRALERPA